MTVTLTLNPCLDRTLSADGAERARMSGGKGLNAARVMGNLGAPCLAIAPLGGAVGDEVARLARLEGIRLAPVRIDGETRVVDTVVLDGGETRVTVGRPPEMTDDEIARLEEAALAAIRGARALAVCGSACCKGAAEAGARLIDASKRLGVMTFLDSNGYMLEVGAAAKPDVLKINESELTALCGAGETRSKALALADSGIGRVIVTLGARGVYSTELDAEIPSPRVKCVNAVGSGDSFAAAWLWKTLAGASPRAALEAGCAAGAANARVFPAARVTRDEIELVLRGEAD